MLNFSGAQLEALLLVKLGLTELPPLPAAEAKFPYVVQIAVLCALPPKDEHPLVLLEAFGSVSVGAIQEPGQGPLSCTHMHSMARAH